MIGQRQCKLRLQQWVQSDSVPRFIIIEGIKGSGRTTFADLIATTIHAQALHMGTSIAEVRQAISLANTMTEPVVFIFQNCENMRQESQNALLKVVEECPNQSYFIMTCTSGKLLPTLYSRGSLVMMMPYTLAELEQCPHTELGLKYSTNVGQLVETSDEELKNAENVACAVLQAIYDRSCTNLLKELKNIKSKGTDNDKVDCDVFWRVFMTNLDGTKLNMNTIRYVTLCSQQIESSTANKNHIITTTLLNVIQELKNAEVS